MAALRLVRLWRDVTLRVRQPPGPQAARCGSGSDVAVGVYLNASIRVVGLVNTRAKRTLDLSGEQRMAEV